MLILYFYLFIYLNSPLMNQMLSEISNIEELLILTGEQEQIDLTRLVCYKCINFMSF